MACTTHYKQWPSWSLFAADSSQCYICCCSRMHLQTEDHTARDHKKQMLKPFPHRPSQPVSCLRWMFSVTCQSKRKFTTDMFAQNEAFGKAGLCLLVLLVITWQNQQQMSPIHPNSQKRAKSAVSCMVLSSSALGRTSWISLSSSFLEEEADPTRSYQPGSTGWRTSLSFQPLTLQNSFMVCSQFPELLCFH